jgi:hypothetical protein
MRAPKRLRHRTFRLGALHNLRILAKNSPGDGFCLIRPQAGTEKNA